MSTEDSGHTSAPLAHIVYFTLHDRSPAAVEHLVRECHTYLSGHPDTLYFGVGTRNMQLVREVNDQEFDVALHVVFASREAHDQYQVSERHQQFIAGNRASWSRVRVFDADLSGSGD